MALDVKSRIWLVLETPDSQKGGHVVIITMMTVIFYSISLLAAETVPQAQDVDYRFWVYSDVVCSSIFSLEFTLRYICCPSRKLLKRDFLVKPMTIVDILAIAPFYITLMVLPGLPQSQSAYENSGNSSLFRIIRVIRIARVLRVLKAGRYSSHLKVFYKTFNHARSALTMLLFVLVLLIIFFAALMFECENEAQPDSFSSIAAAMWYCVITMTTIGYGDMVPITVAGKLVGSIAMVLGPMVIALPVSIIGSESVKEYDIQLAKKKKDIRNGELSDSEAKKTEEDKIDMAFGGKLRTLAYEFLSEPQSSGPAHVWHVFIALVICLSTITIVLSTLPALIDKVTAWNNIEIFCVSVFSFDYVFRWLLVPEMNSDMPQSSPFKSLGRVGQVIARRLKFMIQAFSIIDLLAVLPFYITLALSTSSGSYSAVRVVRLARVVRIFKLGKGSHTVDVMVKAFKMGTPALGMLAMYLMAYLFLTGALVYECEKGYAGTEFNSIPASFWWGMATVTTVGYGDIVPKTGLGKLVGSFAAVFGLIGMTLPLTIIGVFFANLNVESSDEKETVAVAVNMESVEMARTEADFTDDGKRECDKVREEIEAAIRAIAMNHKDICIGHTIDVRPLLSSSSRTATVPQ